MPGKKTQLLDSSDEDLMRLYQSDEEVAFQLLYRRYAGRIYGYFRNRIGNHEAAGELCQTTFMKLHSSRSLYNSSLPFAPWLFTIARNSLIDWQRAQASQQQIFQYGIDTDEIKPEPDSDHGAAVIPFKSLPNAQRQAVELRYLDELSFDDIATRLSTTPMNARQLVSRGVKKLRTLVSAKEKKA